MKLLQLLILVSSSLFTIGQKLNDGDILFTSIQSDNYDSFTFVALQEIPSNTIIYFTDDAIDSLQHQRGSEGTIIWTAPSEGISQGDVVSIEKLNGFTTNRGHVTSKGTFVLATTGDQVFAYQITNTDTSYICAINFNTNKSWLTTGEATSSQSYKPNNLTSIISFRFHRDNGTFDLCINDTLELTTLKKRILNHENWLVSDELIQEYCNSFLLPLHKPNQIYKFNIYPNPSTQNNINFSKELTNIKIYNTNGQLILQNEKAVNINTTNLKPGLYYITSEEGNATFVLK